MIHLIFLVRRLVVTEDDLQAILKMCVLILCFFADCHIRLKKTSLFRWHNQEFIKISINQSALDVKITLKWKFWAKTQPCFKISLAKSNPPGESTILKGPSACQAEQKFPMPLCGHGEETVADLSAFLKRTPMSS